MISPLPQDDRSEFDYSVIIPAFNEEEYLPKTLEALNIARKQLTVFAGECIVVDNQSTDNTVAVAHKYGCRVVQEPIRQISRARNTGAKAALGANLVFVDADTIVPSETFAKALHALEGNEILCGGARLSFDQTYGRWISGKLLPAMWNFISEKMKFFAGSFIFCKADLFFECGGFPESHFAGEEIVLAKNLKRTCRKRGKQVMVISTPPVISSARKLNWYSDWAMLKMILPLIGLPFFLRNRKACRFWYQRPTKD